MLGAGGGDNKGMLLQTEGVAQSLFIQYIPVLFACASIQRNMPKILRHANLADAITHE